jgi:hypothetical protein
VFSLKTGSIFKCYYDRLRFQRVKEYITSEIRLQLHKTGNVFQLSKFQLIKEDPKQKKKKNVKDAEGNGHSLIQGRISVLTWSD